ncbi:MAG: Hsp20/alpha crystallin family protein [Bacteroidales bacterium]|nr:Hsp20/alpha crystallin family protein [Lachnoclostridium sp.]MCM1383741.1 Hsp20/alpha crystallin family protein [Lachnoclostridium sp.]MCM1464369.1 Hsp20/alpha crystallin family protein [Bacteroidales bacterium]
MLFPSVKSFNQLAGEDLFDDVWANFPFESDWFGRKNPLYGKNAQDMMKTDICEKENAYEVSVDLPGFSKEDIHVKLENGYMTISATKEQKEEEKDKDGKYIRRERYSGSVSRSFYVGDALTSEDVKARYENGILQLTVPKKEPKALEQNSYIAIE